MTSKHRSPSSSFVFLPSSSASGADGRFLGAHGGAMYRLDLVEASRTQILRTRCDAKHVRWLVRRLDTSSSRGRWERVRNGNKRDDVPFQTRFDWEEGSVGSPVNRMFQGIPSLLFEWEWNKGPSVTWQVQLLSPSMTPCARQMRCRSSVDK